MVLHYQRIHRANSFVTLITASLYTPSISVYCGGGVSTVSTLYISWKCLKTCSPWLLSLPNQNYRMKRYHTCTWSLRPHHALLSTLSTWGVIDLNIWQYYLTVADQTKPHFSHKYQVITGHCQNVSHCPMTTDPTNCFLYQHCNLLQLHQIQFTPHRTYTLYSFVNHPTKPLCEYYPRADHMAQRWASYYTIFGLIRASLFLWLLGSWLDLVGHRSSSVASHCTDCVRVISLSMLCLIRFSSFD